MMNRNKMYTLQAMMQVYPKSGYYDEAMESKLNVIGVQSGWRYDAGTGQLTVEMLDDIGQYYDNYEDWVKDIGEFYENGGAEFVQGVATCVMGVATTVASNYSGNTGDSQSSGNTENTDWYNPDGSKNYPPNNGAIPGTEQNVTLKPGDRFGRYGKIESNSDYVTEVNANSDTLSLPPWTDPSTYQEFKVIEEIPNVTQSTVRAWGGSPGGGIQYKLPVPIQKLIEGEVIK